MSDAKYSKSGWYDNNSFAFDESTAEQVLRKVYIGEVRRGERDLKLPADEFEGQSYSDILEWSFNKWMDSISERIKNRCIIVLPSKTFTHHSADEARTTCWFNMSTGKNAYSDFSPGNFMNAMWRLDVPLGAISEYMGDHCPEYIPESGEILQTALDSVEDYDLDDGGHVTAVPFDEIADVYSRALGQWIVAHNVREFSLGPRMRFKFGYLDDLIEEYEADNKESE